MKGPTADLLIVLFLVALAIFQIVRKSRRPRPQPPPRPARGEIASEEAQEAAWVSAHAAQSVYPTPIASASQFGRSEALGVPATRPKGRFSRHSLVGNRRELRRAIVITAILGPCRALEPHDLRS